MMSRGLAGSTSRWRRLESHLLEPLVHLVHLDLLTGHLVQVLMKRVVKKVKKVKKVKIISIN